jgi:hypothetical protein
VVSLNKKAVAEGIVLLAVAVAEDRPAATQDIKLLSEQH